MNTDRRMSDEEFRLVEDKWVADVARVQSAWQTPRGRLEAIVGRISSDPPVAWERIHGGLSGEAHVCVVGDARLVIRVARMGVPHFEQERWAIAAARGRGVPAPEVLLVAHEDIDGQIVSFCVERFIAGTPLGALARRRGRDDAFVAAAARRAGAILGTLHEVPTAGYGELRADGRGPLKTWRAFLDERLGPVAPGQPPEVDRALRMLDEHRDLLDATVSRLVHFDYEPGHILVDESIGEVTGILDFEDAKAGDIAYDFAQWDVVHSGYAPVEQLARGYFARVPPTGEFARRRLLGEIHYRARQLVRGVPPPGVVAGARRRLDLAIDALMQLDS